MKLGRIFCLAILLLTASFSTWASDFHISPGGSDDAAGTAQKPWRTLEKANQQRFQPGDRLLLEGGATFAGTLKLGPNDSGTADRRLLVASYGNGPATIDGGRGRAISIDGCNYVDVQNLKLIGAGRKTGNTESGLHLAHATGVKVDHVDVSGFRQSGVEIDGATDARITFVHAHENGFAGISSGGAVSKNLYIGDCLAENNPGDPTVKDNHSGNGIVVGYASGALVERCEARYNGWDMVWTGNGPVGIWTYESDRVTIQFCISHHNRSTATDGGGYDLDGGATNCLVQYNYSHDNYGTGYLICQYLGGGRFEGNTVRYNISQDDGLKAHDAGIYVWIGGEHMVSTLIHNNTVFNNKGSAVAIVADKPFVNEKPRFTFYNNIFVSLADQILGADRGQFAGNVYWSMGERGFHVDGYDSLEKWAAATGQEKIGDRIAGLFADPLLRKDGPGLLTDPRQLMSLHEYEILPASPAVGAGVDLRAKFGIDPGERDFYGNPLPPAGATTPGAQQAGLR